MLARSLRLLLLGLRILSTLLDASSALPIESRSPMQAGDPSYYSQRHPGPNPNLHRRSDARADAHRGLRCDEGGASRAECSISDCSRISAPYGVILLDMELPRGRCFTPGQTIDFRWKVAERPGLAHAGVPPSNDITANLSIASVEPEIGFIVDPRGSHLQRRFPSSGPQRSQCLSSGQSTLIIDSFISGNLLWPANASPWFLALYTDSPSDDGRRSRLLDMLQVPDPSSATSVFDGFVVSSAEGCKEYQRRLDADPNELQRTYWKGGAPPKKGSADAVQESWS